MCVCVCIYFKSVSSSSHLYLHLHLYLYHLYFIYICSLVPVPVSLTFIVLLCFLQFFYFESDPCYWLMPVSHAGSPSLWSIILHIYIYIFLSNYTRILIRIITVVAWFQFLSYLYFPNFVWCTYFHETVAVITLFTGKRNSSHFRKMLKNDYFFLLSPHRH